MVIISALNVSIWQGLLLEDVFKSLVDTVSLLPILLPCNNCFKSFSLGYRAAAVSLFPNWLQITVLLVIVDIRAQAESIPTLRTGFPFILAYSLDNFILNSYFCSRTLLETAKRSHHMEYSKHSLPFSLVLQSQ